MNEYRRRRPGSPTPVGVYKAGNSPSPRRAYSNTSSNSASSSERRSSTAPSPRSTKRPRTKTYSNMSFNNFNVFLHLLALGFTEKEADELTNVVNKEKIQKMAEQFAIYKSNPKHVLQILLGRRRAPAQIVNIPGVNNTVNARIQYMNRRYSEVGSKHREFGHVHKYGIARARRPLKNN